MNCTGCPRFDCAAQIRLASVGSATEETCMLWMRNHKLTVQSVSCERGHERVLCNLKGGKFHCPVRSCRNLMSQDGPLKHSKTKVSAKQILIGIVSFSYSMLGTEVAKEEEVSQRTVVLQRQIIEKSLSEVHKIRQRNAEGTVSFMQVDETWFSKIKRGGNNRNQRVRAGGSQIVQTLAECTRDSKLTEIHVTPVPQKSAEHLIPPIEAMCASSRTRIHTDGARHNNFLEGKYQWDSVIHRNEWISDSGVHTNTVEGANSMLKRTLTRCGGQLGRSNENRHERVRALAEKCNGSLRVNGASVLKRVLEDLRVYCAHYVLQ